MRKFTKFSIAVAGAIALTSLVLSQTSFAQDLEDSLDAELDALSNSETAPSNKPSTSSEKSAPVDDFDAEVTEAPLEGPADLDLPEAKEEIAEPTVEPDPIPEQRSEPAPVVSLAPASDEPNEAFESRLARIYSANSEPMSDERWSELLGVRASETYEVQPGDTLWDLSKTLFGDGFYWSKLWAENPAIQNPHRISKGQALSFIGGNEALGPEVRVVKVEEDPLNSQVAFEKPDVVPAIKDIPVDDKGVKASTITQGAEVRAMVNEAPLYQEDMNGKITQSDIDSGVVIEQAEIIPRPQLPPPTMERKSVLRDLPSTFIERRPKIVDNSVEVTSRSRLAERMQGAIVPGYLAMAAAPEPLGTLDEVDAGEMIASLGQDVFIRTRDQLAIGAKVYSAIERYGVPGVNTSKIGVAMEVGGVIEIREKVSEGIYRGTVVYAVNPVRVESLILPGQPPRVPVSTRGNRNTAAMTVVGGSFSDTRRFFGDGSLVFLDAGDTSVRVGDVLAVQARMGERKKSIAPDYQKPIGILKVYAVSGKVVSAVVVLATSEIRIGDRTGARFPERLPDLRQTAPRVTKLE